MGLGSNRGAPRGSVKTGPYWIPLSAIRGGHGLTAADGMIARGHERDPIEITPSGGIFTARYRPIDGMKRLRAARTRGERNIRAYVWAVPR